MSNTAKKKYIVITAQGTEVEVQATRAEEDDNGSRVKFYDGEDVIASFRSYSSFHPVS